MPTSVEMAFRVLRIAEAVGMKRSTTPGVDNTQEFREYRRLHTALVRRGLRETITEAQVRELERAGNRVVNWHP